MTLLSQAKWQSGLMRQIRNLFLFEGTGSNPVFVDFCFDFTAFLYLRKIVFAPDLVPRH